MMRSTATYSTGYQQHSYNAFPQEAAQVHDTKWLLQPVRIQAWYISLLSFKKEKIEKSQLCVTEDDHFSYYGFQRWYMLSNMYKSGNHWILFVILGFHSKAFLSEQWMVRRGDFWCELGASNDHAPIQPYTRFFF